jgi:hypothetical protein
MFHGSIVFTFCKDVNAEISLPVASLKNVTEGAEICEYLANICLTREGGSLILARVKLILAGRTH